MARRKSIYERGVQRTDRGIGLQFHQYPAIEEAVICQDVSHTPAMLHSSYPEFLVEESSRVEMVTSSCDEFHDEVEYPVPWRIPIHMDLPSSRWYSVIKERRSRRQFDPAQLIEPALLAALRRTCTEFRPFPHARAELIAESADKVFKGAVGPYGKVRGTLSFIALIGSMHSPHVQEEVGYTGEGIVLEATSLGLAACWVGGFFRPEVAASLARISVGEKVLAVTPIGYAKRLPSPEERLMTGFGRTHRRKPLSGLVTGLDQREWPDWIGVSLEAARLAPSAVNRQPWGFHVEPGSVTVFVRAAGPDFGVSKRLDCGIAMLHIEVTALNCGVRGNWEFLEPPQVGRFTATSNHR